MDSRRAETRLLSCATILKKLSLPGATVSISAAFLALAAPARATDTMSAPEKPAPAAPEAAPPQVDCSVNPDPYKNYSCLDSYLGTNVAVRLLNYYKLEMGQSAAPADPNAPPGRRDGWPATPEPTPPPRDDGRSPCRRSPPGWRS